ncbi:MAG: hypothetical protein R2754_06980 [Microthrixaceae bacterium]
MWSDPANWSSRAVPVPNDNVCIPDSGTTVQIDSDVNVRWILAEANLQLTASRTLTLTDSEVTSELTNVTASGTTMLRGRARIRPQGTFTLTQRSSLIVTADSKFINDGRTVLTGGSRASSIRSECGGGQLPGEIRNSGVMLLGSWASIEQSPGCGRLSWLLNDGVLKAEGRFSAVRVGVMNRGTATAIRFFETLTNQGRVEGGLVAGNSSDSPIAGGVWAGVEFQGRSGGVVEFDGPVLEGSTIIAGGIAAGHVDIPAEADLTVRGATLRARVTGPGAFSADSGAILDTDISAGGERRIVNGRFINVHRVKPGAVLSVPRGETITIAPGAFLTNEGRMDFQHKPGWNAGRVLIECSTAGGGAGTISNKGQLDFQGNGTVRLSSTCVPGDSTLKNEGEIRVVGAGAEMFDVQIHNYENGLIEGSLRARANVINVGHIRGSVLAHAGFWNHGETQIEGELFAVGGTVTNTRVLRFGKMGRVRCYDCWVKNEVGGRIVIDAGPELTAPYPFTVPDGFANGGVIEFRGLVPRSLEIPDGASVLMGTGVFNLDDRPLPLTYVRESGFAAMQVMQELLRVFSPTPGVKGFCSEVSAGAGAGVAIGQCEVGYFPTAYSPLMEERAVVQYVGTGALFGASVSGSVSRLEGPNMELEGLEGPGMCMAMEADLGFPVGIATAFCRSIPNGERV